MCKLAQVEEEDVVVTENGRKADKEHAGSERDVLTTLNLNTFYVLQDIASGTFVNFVSPSTELKMYLDLKRSIFKELNPVIDTTAETAIGPAGGPARVCVFAALDPAGRAALCDSALALMRSVGYTNAGIIMAVVTVVTCGFGGFVMGVIGLVEGIIYLSKTPEEFKATYLDAKREWFWCRWAFPRR